MADPESEKESKSFFDSLTKSEKMLVILRDELYESSWDLMLKDLNSRLKGEPFIFKLADRIDSDIKCIDKIKSFEKKKNVNMGDFINLKSEGLSQ
ncbi:MAG: hypothetical protein COA79_03815 [Planctomycetota bacterium]|nr:MAG: hypothetical protein COA79_03815 [Planctomycetota bacterium]